MTDSAVAVGSAVATEERVAVASQWQLTWLRFRKHKPAMVAAVVVFGFYFVALFADFFAYADPAASSAHQSYMPPQAIHLLDDGRFSPYVNPVVERRDPRTLQMLYEIDPTRRIELSLLSRGFTYSLLGISMDVHLIGPADETAQQVIFLLGTDQQGRDLWSRVIYATRTSLTIGLVAVALSLFLGVLLGGISGFYGGAADVVIQRVIEILRSVPTIPLWMGLAAMMPREWDITQVYFAITIIISLIGWTELARVVRGKFLSLREADFVLAAELAGSNQLRIIFRHLVPLFLSHIIAATTLALPQMIISETALSFLGLGLRAPAISWGVLLQSAQNIQTIALAPWLLTPALVVSFAVLAFNFLGDGLRDAADPYGI